MFYYALINSYSFYCSQIKVRNSISLMLINDVLSVGPCALEYTKLKTSDHFWTDPSANELVQRHRIHGAHRGQDTSAGRRPALGVSVEAVLHQLLRSSGDAGIW